MPKTLDDLLPVLERRLRKQGLSEFMEKCGPALTDQQLVDVIKALHGAGLIKAEVKSR